jgi:hypothetical protein
LNSSDIAHTAIMVCSHNRFSRWRVFPTCASERLRKNAVRLSVRGIVIAALASFSMAYAGDLRSVVSDRPVPGATGGSLTVHVEAGRGGRDFHVSFERNGAFYVYYDGKTWSSPLQLTTGQPFRSGVHLAIDDDNVVHAAWVEGGGDRKGTVKYRSIRNGRLGLVEDVHAPQGWNECDIAIDHDGRPVIAANTTTQSELAIYERADSAEWKQTVLPSDNTLHKWAPTIVSADDGLLYVAFRRKDAHPFTWQVRDKGVWTKDAALPWRSYEPNAIALGSDLIASSLDGYVYRVEKRDGTFVTSHHDVRTIKRGVIRGQHVGIGRTTAGTLVLAHSDMKRADQRDRTITREHRFFLSWSTDNGTTWTYNRPISPDAGQGHGNLAVNGDWIMAVWPDIRGGPHIRYALWRDQVTVEKEVSASFNFDPSRFETGSHQRLAEYNNALSASPAISPIVQPKRADRVDRS